MAEDESLRSPSSLQEVQDIQAAPRTDPSTELDCIRAVLHAKEMENLRVTRDLEEVKALLALIHAKAAAELAQAKQQAAKKDRQLQMAQQALLSLKMVHVEWWWKGHQVELAGSFNGWGHHLCLFPDLASESPKHDRDGSRGAMMWAVDLWLYPGIYEIKFIVDGKWQIDHQREEVQHNLGSNNLLQVDP
ncbi:hypothetical protein BDL97_10G063100 [Sphagnum fallax]|nr:hypothetical protein BDL97_10G063100 [Sphagnum fallax]